MPSPLVELPSIAAELILCSEFHEGPVTGLVRAPALAASVPGVTELVYGPAGPGWRADAAVRRAFAAAPIPSGSSQALLDACPWPERWRAAPVYDVSTDHPPGAIAAILEPFRASAPKSAPFLIRFAQDWCAVRVWRAADGGLIDAASAAADLPG